MEVALTSQNQLACQINRATKQEVTGEQYRGHRDENETQAALRDCFQGNKNLRRIARIAHFTHN
jgi:hypothetical protein